VAKKSASKKAAKKKAVKKTATKKKAAAKKAVSKKAVTKKTAAKKAAAKKSPAKKKTVTKKAASKKAVTKKTTAKKRTTSKKATKKKRAKSQAAKTQADKIAAAAGHTISQGAAAKKKAAGTKKRGRAVITTNPATKLSYAARLAQEAADAEALNAEPLTIPQLKKKKNDLSKKQMAFLKQELLERRAEILGDIESLGKDATGDSGSLSNMPLHMADVGTDNYDREFTLGLMETERKILIQIDEALIRIKEGYYGVCMETGDPIGFARLEFKPWAKYSIEVARERERKGLQ